MLYVEVLGVPGQSAGAQLGQLLGEVRGIAHQLGRQSGQQNLLNLFSVTDIINLELTTLI